MWIVGTERNGKVHSNILESIILDLVLPSVLVVHCYDKVNLKKISKFEVIAEFRYLFINQERRRIKMTISIFLAFMTVIVFIMVGVHLILKALSQVNKNLGLTAVQIIKNQDKLFS